MPQNYVVNGNNNVVTWTKDEDRALLRAARTNGISDTTWQNLETTHTIAKSAGDIKQRYYVLESIFRSQENPLNAICPPQITSQSSQQ